MNASSSRPNSRSTTNGASTRNGSNSFTVANPTQLEFDRARILAERIDDSHIIRTALVEAIRACGKSREQLADEMTELAGRKVTPRMLNGYTAESQEDYIFPAELTRAFCVATGDVRLLAAIAETLHCVVVEEDEAELLELGRAFLQRQKADEQMSLLQRRLHGRDL